MAASAGVPIVPVTISDLARWYPKGTLLPIGIPTDVVVTIHPPVYTTGPNKVSESDAIAQTYDAVRAPAPSPHRPPIRMLDRRPVLLRARSTLPCRPTRGGRPIASSK